MSFIKFENISKEYHVGENMIKAVDDISFSLEKGSFTVVLGQSGAGKTTVLNLMGGMDSPTRGKIYVDGREISGFNKEELTTYRRNMIGFVFQFYNLVPNLTVLENVQLAQEICQFPFDPKELIVKVGLKHRMDNFPSQLSGGEQQRVSIARALAKNPQIVLCDEPTGALDSETGRLVLKLIQEVARDLQKTVMIITHNAVIAEMAQNVIYMRDGKINEIKRNASPKNAEEVQW